MDFDALAEDIDRLRTDIATAEAHWAPWLHRVAPRHRRSAQNMVHYWALRQHDLRGLQTRLSALGLSSLGRCEPHVQATADLIAAALTAMRGGGYHRPTAAAISVAEGPALLARRADELLGRRRAERSVRIMVTLPSEAAEDPTLVEDLIAAGMDVARINCAHDDAPAWRAMAEHVGAAAAAAQRSCLVAMDLGGPKLRTVALGPKAGALTLGGGDRLRLVPDDATAPADIPCIATTLPELFDPIAVGDAMFFDDGKLGGVVESVGAEGIDVRIEHPARGTARLKSGKGINVPDTDLAISALTDKDVKDLATVVEIADIVELSFVRDPVDVQRLLDELDRRGADDLGVVLKIETRSAFEKLPQLLMTAMQRNRVGVMVARGDLAVEVGYERMAEIQEEMLWLCEAAHLPVLWATQVLERLAKKGQPTRAEVSDAAMGVRAECVMLNKGRYITDAVGALDSILRRMEAHAYKKNSLLRTLTSWRPDAATLRGR
nr:pyruvate kinase [Mycobacterium sp. SMC-4]